MKSVASLRAAGLGVVDVDPICLSRPEKLCRGTGQAVATAEALALDFPAAGTSAGPGDRTEVQPIRIPAATPLPQLADGRSFAILSYNVLLPNSEDGWWIYKYYRQSGSFTEWPARQALLREQLLRAAADVICLQEASDISFADDFAFLTQEGGYEALLHEKGGRMRPATFWLSRRWELVLAAHKDRALITALRCRCGATAGSVVFVVNVHMAAGPSADRRLRQAHEALTAVAKEAKKLKLEPRTTQVVFCGDFNSQGNSAVREFLRAGVVGPEFRESGDPTERGQEGKQITSKVKQHDLAHFADAAEVVFPGNVPSTILAANIDSKMLHSEGTLTQAIREALGEAFEHSCPSGQTAMDGAAVDRWLTRINREVGRGSEFRSAMEIFARRGGEEVLDRDDFIAIYQKELAEGKFWGVEHDLQVLRGTGLAQPTEGPVTLRFDYIYFTEGPLRLVGVQEPLSEEQRGRIWGSPWEILPNAWHPSDHLPVAAVFELGQ